MKKIYKYPLNLAAGIQYITMSVEAEIVHFAMQGDGPCIWAKVDIYAALHQRRFCILGTGFEIPENYAYIGTALHGAYVWHLFEEK